MKRPYLAVTFRKGRAIAGYLYLPRPTGAKAARTLELRPGLLVDYTATGEPIGIERADPAQADVAFVNAVLGEQGAALVAAEDLAPLHAA